MEHLCLQWVSLTLLSLLIHFLPNTYQVLDTCQVYTKDWEQHSGITAQQKNLKSDIKHHFQKLYWELAVTKHFLVAVSFPQEPITFSGFFLSISQDSFSSLSSAHGHPCKLPTWIQHLLYSLRYHHTFGYFSAPSTLCVFFLKQK